MIIKFSIIIPFYNNLSNIDNLHETLLDYKDDPEVEIIFIEDCGRLLDFENLKKQFLSFSNVKILQNEKNSGPSMSRMNGVWKSKGEYIFFLDADDGWSKNKAYCQYEFNKKNNVVISGGGVVTTSNKDFSIQRKKYEMLEHNIRYISFNKALFFNPFATTSVGVLREVIINNPFDHTMRYAEDIDCWRRILLKYKGCIYNDSGAYNFKNSYLSDENSLSYNIFKMFKGNIYSLNKALRNNEVGKIDKFLVIISMIFSFIKLIFRVCKKIKRKFNND